MKRNAQIRFVLVLIFASLILAACGRDSDDSASEGVTSTAAVADSESETAPEATPDLEKGEGAEEDANTKEIEQVADALDKTQPESPLSQPDSPLSHPESPLAGPESPLPTPVPDPEAGTGTVVGRLINITSRQPLNNTVVRLAEIVCPDDFVEDPTDETMRDQCVFSLDGAFSPSAITDDNGDFIFEGVVANNYVLFIGDHMMDYAVVKDENEGLALYRVEPDKVLYLDEVAVDF